MTRADELLDLPRSALLALWLHGVDATPRRTVVAVRGDDEPHDVTGPSVPLGTSLDELVAGWLAGAAQAAAVLPVPGDVAGLPAEVAEAAVEAGECLLVHANGRSWAAVPEVEQFGSDLEPGHLVTWQVEEVGDWQLRLPGAVGTLTEAETALRGAMREATDALASLDVARWRPDAAEAVASLRADVDPQWPLPSGLAPRALRVLVTAVRLRAIVSLATADDGGAVNLWQADQRSAALRHVDHAARHAVAAATAAAGRR